MAYQILTFFSLVLAALILLAALRLLFSSRWILGWLRGSSGLILVLIAFCAGLVALEFSEFEPLDKQKPIASLSFSQLSPQQFKVSVMQPAGGVAEYTLAGDMWQIDAKIFKWARSLESIGFLPGYQLGRLQGRYYALDEERQSPRTVYDLQKPAVGGISFWQSLHNHNYFNPWLTAIYGSATFLPMADGAIYTVKLSTNGLVAEPSNEPARHSVNEWQ